MKVFRSLDAARAADLRGSAVTLGVFDGVHLGHRAVLRDVVAAARSREAPAVVATFARHPRAVIEGQAPQLITALRHKLRILETCGIDATMLLRFDDVLRGMEPEEFVREILVGALGASCVVLGYNNRFGAGGRGDFALLERLADSMGFEARRVDQVRLDGDPVSSTAIRTAILEGDLDRATRMLGRPFSVLGRVVQGDHLGAQLGYPTANLNLHHEVRPPRGVYGCEVRLRDGRHHGLVNIGVRPTVTGRGSGGPDDSWEVRDRLERIEVHILDFDGDLYGRNVELVFLRRMRGERRFASVDHLKEQIRTDCEAFTTWLESR